jgi:hypothetical protein
VTNNLLIVAQNFLVRNETLHGNLPLPWRF